MRIDKVSLLNFRCFRSLEITFDPEITILVAPNGAGKTTVLDAVRFALYTFVKGFDIGEAQPVVLQSEDLRLVYQPDALNMEIASPTKITYSGRWGIPLHKHSGEISLTRLPPVNLGALRTPFRLSDQQPRYIPTPSHDQSEKIEYPSEYLTNWAKELQTLVRDEERSEPVQLPLVLYLGTARMWYQGRYNLENNTQRLDNSAFSRLSGYDQCLSATSGYKQFEQWYTWLWQSLREFQIKSLENQSLTSSEKSRADRMQEAIQAIQQAINSLIQGPTGWFNLEYSASHNQQLVMNHPQHGKLPLSQLSDGLRNTVAMVADIAFRCVKLNPHLRTEAAMKTQGIVLIDEVDMFLHPAWQQQIIQSLRSAFPLIQFIVTTHSPQVISTVQRNSIRLLSQDDKSNGYAVIPPGATYGEPSNDVLQSVMNVDPQPPVAEKAELQELTVLVDQGKYDSQRAQQLLSRLQGILGKQHSQLQRLERSIARQKLMQGKA